MRSYEVVIILDAGLEEEAIRASVDRSSDLIRSRGGDPVRVDRWGRRRLAYELDHRTEGYYVLLHTQAEPMAVAELERALHLADEVIRHKVVRIPDRVAGRMAQPAEGDGEAPATTGPNANGA